MDVTVCKMQAQGPRRRSELSERIRWGGRGLGASPGDHRVFSTCTLRPAPLQSKLQDLQGLARDTVAASTPDLSTHSRPRGRAPRVTPQEQLLQCACRSARGTSDLTPWPPRGGTGEDSRDRCLLLRREAQSSAVHSPRPSPWRSGRRAPGSDSPRLPASHPGILTLSLKSWFLFRRQWPLLVAEHFS